MGVAPGMALETMTQSHDSIEPVPDIAAAMTELTELMLATSSIDEMLDELARLAAKVLAPPGECGITVRRDHELHTVAASGPLAAQVDEVQYGHDEGPCLQALRTGEIVDVPELASDTRWDTYRIHALGFGVRSSLSLPLAIDGDVRGALNIYATVAHAFGPTERRHAEIFGFQAAAALTVVTRQSRQVELSEQLRTALASRAVIDQALGIIMDQQRCDAETAFAMLRNLSQHRNRKLREIATEIVQAITGKDPLPGPFHEPS